MVTGGSLSGIYRVRECSCAISTSFANIFKQWLTLSRFGGKHSGLHICICSCFAFWKEIASRLSILLCDSLLKTLCFAKERETISTLFAAFHRQLLVFSVDGIRIGIVIKHKSMWNWMQTRREDKTKWKLMTDVKVIGNNVVIFLQSFSKLYFYFSRCHLKSSG